MHLLRFYILFVFTAFINHSFSQSIQKTDWEKHIGNFWNDEASDVIQNKKGEIVVIGNTTSLFHNKVDVLFVVIDQYQKVRIEKNIGRDKNDVAHALIQSFDGGYVFVGYTMSNAKGYQGGKDAWIVKTDEQGNVLWDKLLGTKNDDEFYDLVQDKNGNLIATGHFANQIRTIIFDAKGKQLMDIPSDNLSSEIGRSLIIDKDNNIVVTGYLESAQTVNTILYKYNRRGIKLWKREFGQSKGLQILQNKKGNYVITGTDFSNNNRANMLFIETNTLGRKIDFKSFGGRELDSALGMTQSIDGRYIGVGYTRSFTRGAKRTRLWINRFDRGQDINEETTFGGKQDDIGSQIIQMNDASLLAIGTTASQSLLKDAWVIKFESDGFPRPIGRPQILANNIQFVDENGNEILEASERGYVIFDLVNQGDGDAYQIDGKIRQLSGPLGINCYTNIEFGSLAAGQQKRLSIPVKGNGNIDNGISQFKLSFSTYNKLAIPNLNFKIKSQKEPEPILTLTQAQFDNGANFIQRNTPTTLSVTLQNTGNKKAENAKVIFSFPYKVESLSQKIIELGDLAPNESKQLSFKFKALPAYFGEDINIGCRIKEKTSKFGSKKDFSIPFVKENPKIGSVEEQNFIDLEWVNGQALRITDKEITWEKEKVILIGRASSNKPLTRSSFKLIFNDAGEQANTKSDITSTCLCETQKDKKTNNYIATLRCSVNLKYGLNAIALKVQNDAGSNVSSKLLLRRPIVKPNLYILSIGVPDKAGKLKYTTKDASDFAKIFEQQNNPLFNQIDIRLFNTNVATTTTSIQERLQDLANEFEVNQIKKEDFIMIFISSHGRRYQDGDEVSFRLHASDYKELYPKQYSIDFKTDIIDILKAVDCNKVLFIDACQSGAIGQIPSTAKTNPSFEDMSDALISLLEAERDLKTIASCSAQEYSYEHPTLKNGVFTRALIEAFNNQSVPVDKKKRLRANTNDNFLGIDELHFFLQKRIPYLLKSIKPKPTTSQTPYIAQKHISESLPIYFLGNK